MKTYTVTVTITHVTKTPDELSMRTRFDFEDELAHIFGGDLDEQSEIDYTCEEEIE